MQFQTDLKRENMGVTEKLANPAPLGLLGFGLTTVLLNLHNAGFFPLDTMILAMGLAYGGLAQVIVGVMEFKKGNTFGTVAFTSYGLFWWSLVGIFVLPRLSFFNVEGLAAINAPDARGAGGVLFHVGLVHVRHVLRDAEKEPRTTIRVCQPNRAILLVGD